MFKKLIALAMTLCVISVSILALAETPSKTTADLINVSGAVVADGTPIEGLFNIQDTYSEMATAQFADISTFVSKGSPVVSYFPEDAQTGIANLLPEDVDASSLTMSEFVDLDLGDYQESYGDVTSTFSFATEFQPDQTIVAMVGYLDENGDVVWQALPVTIVDGMLQITFPADLMAKMGHDAVLSILST